MTAASEQIRKPNCGVVQVLGSRLTSQTSYFSLQQQQRPNKCLTWGAEQWRSQPKNLGGGKMFDFGRITLFCWEKRLSKHKITIFLKICWGQCLFAPPWLRLWRRTTWPQTQLANAPIRSKQACSFLRKMECFVATSDKVAFKKCKVHFLNFRTNNLNRIFSHF